ncbi:hypothetical protein FQR65_LT01219 [Abscondita terminalis]|nr:hypothetical protein FQR65_LT01219 [Abscondita terminalis]
MASDLENKIINQIEYYFGDFNLSRDKFLQGEIAKDDGWVELTTLLTFGRLASYTTDKQVIVDALKKAENKIVVVSEDENKVRRNPEKPLPEVNENYRKDVMERTAYAKGFPLDESLDNIMKYFADNHGNYESCIKRTYLDRATKEQPKLEFAKGIILHFTGISEDIILTREEIKNKITEINTNEPSFIDYRKGDKEGYVRMSKENEAEEFCKKLTEGVMEVGDAKLQMRFLEGDEETEYLKKTTEIMQKKRQFLKKGGKRGNKRYHGNDNGEAPKNKKVKV